MLLRTYAAFLGIQGVTSCVLKNTLLLEAQCTNSCMGGVRPAHPDGGHLELGWPGERAVEGRLLALSN